MKTEFKRDSWKRNICLSLEISVLVNVFVNILFLDALFA